MIKSYGYPCLSLREVIKQMMDIAERHPEALDAPVWVPSDRLFRPINHMSVQIDATKEYPVALRANLAGVL